MTQEQKDLLLKDLCARLPYGVKVQSYNYEEDIETIETLYEMNSDGYMSTIECDTLKNTPKPYLFPLSSMTGEQKKEYAHLLTYTSNIDMIQITGESTYDWLNKNMFDWRGLIPKGLAIDATGLDIY